MSPSEFPVLSEFSMLLSNNNRAKAYLQSLTSRGYVPASAVLVETGTRRPEQTVNDSETFEDSEQKLIRSSGSTGVEFDEKEHVVTTLERHGTPFEVVRATTVNSDPVRAAVARCVGDYVIYAGPGGAILRSELLSLGKHFLHVHPGWLPDDQGSTVPYFSLLADRPVGCSVICFAEELDRGPLFLRKRFQPDQAEDVDYVFDPASRAATLLEFFKMNHGSAPQPIAVEHSDQDNVYYIIHPVLKHVALLKLRGERA